MSTADASASVNPQLIRTDLISLETSAEAQPEQLASRGEGPGHSMALAASSGAAAGAGPCRARAGCSAQGLPTGCPSPGVCLAEQPRVRPCPTQASGEPMASGSGGDLLGLESGQELARPVVLGLRPLGTCCHYGQEEGTGRSSGHRLGLMGVHRVLVLPPRDGPAVVSWWGASEPSGMSLARLLGPGGQCLLEGERGALQGPPVGRALP